MYHLLTKLYIFTKSCSALQAAYHTKAVLLSKVYTIVADAFDAGSLSSQSHDSCWLNEVTSSAYVQTTDNPKVRSSLWLRCPCFGNGHVNTFPNTAYHVWWCATCTDTLAYVFEENIYCSYGEAKCQTLAFRCTGTRHGNLFKQFTEITICDMLDKSMP